MVSVHEAPGQTKTAWLAQYEAASLPLPEFPGASQTPPRQDPDRRPKVG